MTPKNKKSSDRKGSVIRGGTIAIGFAVSLVALSFMVHAEEPAITVRDVGVALPESALYDEENDVYLVSNINGAPLDVDDNGFISRVAPDGRVRALKWIDGAREDVRLNAPKGMAISGGVLWVADIDTVRKFDAKSGKPLGEIKIDGATFLNDVAAVPAGGVVVSDSGLTAKFEPSKSDALYKIDLTGKVTLLIKSEKLGHPNGVVVEGDKSILVVSFGTGEFYRISETGEMQTPEKLPKGQLDGIVALDNGDILISGWEDEAIYRGRIGGSWTKMMGGIKAPGDIGWDSRRRRLLIPLLQDNALRIQPLP